MTEDNDFLMKFYNDHFLSVVSGHHSGLLFNLGMDYVQRLYNNEEKYEKSL